LTSIDALVHRACKFFAPIPGSVDERLPVDAEGSNRMIRRIIALIGALLLGAVVLPAGAAQAESTRHPAHAAPQLRPVVFVHGFSGSGGQYETQAQRFASNGYPADRIQTMEYDSTFTVETTASIFAKLDAQIVALLARTHADKVDLTAHSLGTSLMQAYLNSTPARAARVAHYVNYDGATATALPGGVPTLAIWGEGPTTRTIVGATNTYLSDESHTQTVTSAESFTAVFTFLTGHAPRTTKVLPQLPGRVQLSGRAVQFPTNVGVPAGSLQVFRVNPVNGHRLTIRPLATFALSGDGAWGPFRASPVARYEFAVVRPGMSTHHFYYESFGRTDQLIRLLTADDGTGLEANTEKSPRTSNIVVNRNKEWWGDQGAAGDTLTIDGTQILNAADAPRTKRVIATFAYDQHLDGVTDLSAPIAAFFAVPFISGVDLVLPAAPRGAGRITAVARPRGGHGHLDVLNSPNWPSTSDRITLQFHDYVN
jgi:pimeloyl-ACP methyl ester carboxylesterase